VHLRDLIGEHVAIVVVGSHTEAAFGPPNDLHRGRVAAGPNSEQNARYQPSHVNGQDPSAERDVTQEQPDEVLQLAAAIGQQTGSDILRLVVSVENALHDCPEALLPLEDGFLRHDIAKSWRAKITEQRDGELKEHGAGTHNGLTYGTILASRHRLKKWCARSGTLSRGL
jgi:hypothetical protein